MRRRHEVVYGETHMASEGEETAHDETMCLCKARPYVAVNSGQDAVF